MSSEVAVSSTCHRLRQTARLPAARNAWANPRNPSPPPCRPSAVSQAESVTRSASSFQYSRTSLAASWPFRKGCPALGAAFGNSVLRQDQGRFKRPHRVRFPMGGEVQVPEVGQCSLVPKSLETLFAGVRLEQHGGRFCSQQFLELGQLNPCSRQVLPAAAPGRQQHGVSLTPFGDRFPRGLLVQGDPQFPGRRFTHTSSGVPSRQTVSRT